MILSLIKNFCLYFAIAYLCLVANSRIARADVQVPNLRLKTGMYLINVNAGDLLTEAPLGAMLTLQPSVLWDLPTFRSRVGIHYLLDFNSTYGLTPISGIGFSGYFYLFGISSAYEESPEGALIQKSRPGPYVFGALTPVNFNVNKLSQQNSNDGFALHAYILEIALGAGYDYPLTRNLILSVEVGYRNGATSSSSGTNTNGVSYSGLGMMLALAMSYY